MNKLLLMHHLKKIFFFTFMFAGYIAGTAQVELNVRLETSIEPFKYAVYARNTVPVTPTIPATLSSTINITIKLPGGYDIDPIFTASSVTVTSFSHGLYQVSAGRNNPSYAPSNDYIYFSMINPLAFNIPEWTDANVEIKLLEFQILDGSCVPGDVSIIDDALDPITDAANEPNQDFSNQFVMMAGGNPAYDGNYIASGQEATTCGEVVNENSSLNARVFLEAALDENTGLMRDDLRQINDFPSTAPYPTLEGLNENGTEVIFPYQPVNNDLESITDAQNVLGDNANQSVVDWLWVELRDENDPTQIMATRSVLLLRDGSIVDVDGASLPVFNIAPGNYYIAIFHRNHLGAMTENPIALGETTSPLVDFTDSNTANFKLSDTNLRSEFPQAVIGNNQALWSGDLNNDGKIISQGPRNDDDWVIDQILTDPQNVNSEGNPNFNFISEGYYSGDVFMEGRMNVQGPTNVLDKIFFTVALHPENQDNLLIKIINRQVP